MVRIAVETGLVTLGTLAIDGTKIRADASKRKAMSHARMKEEEQRIGKEIAAIVAKAKGEDHGRGRAVRSGLPRRRSCRRNCAAASRG
ncbi:MAG: hypothetical protein U0575_03575 [Phycisphaerales bacterium]